MSPVEFWGKTRYTSWHQVTWDGMFYDKRDKTKHVVLVENQHEEDFTFSLQMMFGNEMNIQQIGDEPLSVFLGRYPVVYTTWDPSDRNRI